MTTTPSPTPAPVRRPAVPPTIATIVQGLEVLAFTVATVLAALGNHDALITALAGASLHGVNHIGAV